MSTLPHHRRWLVLAIMGSVLGFVALGLVCDAMLGPIPADAAPGQHNIQCPGCGRESWIPDRRGLASLINWTHRCPYCQEVYDEATLREFYLGKKQRDINRARAAAEVAISPDH